MKSLALALMVVMAIGATAQARQSRTITVFAASSLTDAFEELADSFESLYPEVSVTFNFGASSTLAAQLLNGAPADVFASANMPQMHRVAQAGLLARPPVLFVGNQLVLVVPAANPADLQTVYDLANSGVKLVLAAPGVPARDYTERLLERLAADANRRGNFRDEVLRNVVSEEQNVRQVAAKLILGEADAAIVYRSDITPDIADRVRIIPIPEAANVTAAYPLAVVNTSRQPALAQAFVDFVLSIDGQAILERHGLLPVTTPGLLAVQGDVDSPALWSPADLAHEFPPVEITVGSDTFTGASLADVLAASDVPEGVEVYAVARLAGDGTINDVETVIDPARIKTAVIAYAFNGEPIPESEGPLMLLAPGDACAQCVARLHALLIRAPSRAST